MMSLRTLPKIVTVTNKQATWKTIRGAVAKNLIALMLTGHPLGFIENMIHAPIDWVVNKNLCTDNKLLNTGVHLATCLSVDDLIHGSSHEIAETLMSDGGGHTHGSVHSDMMTNSDLSLSDVVDVTDGATDVDVMIDPPEVSESSTDTTMSEVQQPVAELSVAQGSSTDSPMKTILAQKARSMSKMMEMMGDGNVSASELFQMHQAADAQGLIDHTGHHHTVGDGHIHGDHEIHEGHDHEHGGHGIMPVLGGLIIEEYGPKMWKITTRRVKSGFEDLFNLSSVSDTKFVKKSDVAMPNNSLRGLKQIKQAV